MDGGSSRLVGVVISGSPVALGFVVAALLFVSAGLVWLLGAWGFVAAAVLWLLPAVDFDEVRHGRTRRPVDDSDG